MSETEPGSFRDRAAIVYYQGERVLRRLDDTAAADWQTLSMTAFFRTATEAGRLVGTREAGDVTAPASTLVLEHDRIPFVSYPYEWTFSMLKDAALLHLDLLHDALAEGISLKDGYAYNVQWRGAKPVFIDIGSFERYRGPWEGYGQFCASFLNPLLIEAHLDVAFQPYLRGRLDGIEPLVARKLLRGARRFRRGVFRNVYLHAAIQARSSAKSAQGAVRDLKEVGYNIEIAKATARSLRKVINGLSSKRAESAWSDYRKTCSYSDDDVQHKLAFVQRIASQRPRHLAYDLGCNDGTFARAIAKHVDTVIALDNDDVIVDTLYRTLREDGPANIVPLVVDVLDPSPARGWRGVERQSFEARGKPDLVIALALIHHLAITANVPLIEVVAWLASFGGEVIVEFVEPTDPMAQRLLANKRAGQHEDYERDRFEALLTERCDVLAQETLPSKQRTLYHARPR